MSSNLSPNRRTRYIPRRVRRKLLEEARARCCVSRELLIPGERRLKKIERLLNQHHVMYFSDGGPNTEENLILVCPNCHALIHSEPGLYTLQKLRVLKQHWVAMRNVVPEQLVHPEAEQVESQQTVEVPVLLETVNLLFRIKVPRNLSITRLTECVVDQIVIPLGHYDDNESWRNPERVAISLASRPRRLLDHRKAVSAVGLQDGDAFAVLVHMWTQAAPGDLLILRVEPRSPEPGQHYIAIVTARPGAQIRLDIDGTDGYSANRIGVADETGKFSVQVPGAASGVVDTISATGFGQSLSITLVFTPRIRQPSGTA